MALLSQAKTLGEVGSILAILSIVPGFGWLIGLIGFILVLMAVKQISDSLGEASIFNNMIISVITGIAGLIIGGIFVFGLFFILTPVVTPGEQVNLPNQLLTSYLSIIVVLMILWICFIISSLFLRKSYQTISTQLDTKMFRTVATIYLIGAVTTIVMIGFVLLLIAEIFQIVAFFSMPEQPPPPPPPTPTTSL